ncbi:hypothetical protein [Roseiflexus sp.]|uniref:hypothetical protein n=1 Tax=Roseiflexus sp. TaxID=2562120 RepID=UPI0021DDBC99|nr:hypothetical protein [Roseiflexus sp.]GIW01257.1 MAG: hypothetical protein KatS3mg058_2660 [Roseiflexus sp.]
MENLTFKLLKGAVRVYGAIIVLVLGSYFTLLLAHNDVMLLKAPYHFEWVAGDIILLLIILWGFFFILSSFGKGELINLFCAFLASAISILIGWNNWRMEHLWWLGVLIAFFLFMLPSFTTLMLKRAQESIQNERNAV